MARFWLSARGSQMRAQLIFGRSYRADCSPVRGGRSCRRIPAPVTTTVRRYVLKSHVQSERRHDIYPTEEGKAGFAEWTVGLIPFNELVLYKLADEDWGSATISTAPWQGARRRWDSTMQ